jgi:hypothetical protein
MALNSGFANLNPVSDTFSDWLNKTNEIIRLMREDVVTANTAGGETTGDAILIGSFYANNIIAKDSLRGGDYSASGLLSITSNLHVTNTAADTIVWKNFEVATNTHLGGTTSGTHTLQITGDVLASGEVTFEDVLNVDGVTNVGDSVIPTTTGIDLGTSTLRFDAYLTDGSVNGSLIPTSNTIPLGAVDGRWNLFANTIDASGDSTILGNSEVGGELTVQSTTLMNGVLTVNADAVFVSNVSSNNISAANNVTAKTLRVVDIVANNFGIVGGSNQPTIDASTTDIVIDTTAAADSNGFKYMIEGRNTNADSCYFVEISVAHNGTDVYFTRYGEVSNNFDAIWNVGINGSDVELKVTCAGAAPVTNVHSFNIIKYQTR